MGHQKSHQKKTTAATRSHPTKTSVKSPVHPVEELQGAIGNREMGRLMETNRQTHPSSPFPKLQGELPLLGGMMPVSQGTIQRQPLFRGLSQEMRLDTAMALPATGAVIQPKLTLGTPGDMYEEEADRVARQVVDEIHSSPFREPNTRSHGERKPDGGEAGRVQRQITVRAAGDAGGELSSEWQGELQRAKSGGQPLSPSLKEPMERSFGADFGGVRVHTGAQADRLARSIQAKAFTTGQNVFFRQGAYEPESRGGQELLAHELTHVVQQSSVKKKKETNRYTREKQEQHQRREKNQKNMIATQVTTVTDNAVKRSNSLGSLIQRLQYSNYKTHFETSQGSQYYIYPWSIYRLKTANTEIHQRYKNIMYASNERRQQKYMDLADEYKYMKVEKTGNVVSSYFGNSYAECDRRRSEGRRIINNWKPSVGAWPIDMNLDQEYAKINDTGLHPGHEITRIYTRMPHSIDLTNHIQKLINDQQWRY